MKINAFILLILLAVACQSNDSKTSKMTAPTTESIKSVDLTAEATTDSTRCFGTEPFWDVKFSEKEGTIVFFNVGEDKKYKFPYSPPKKEGENLIYTTQEGKNTLTATLIKGKCSDGMSDLVHTYTSEVVINGQKFKGCANRWYAI